MLDLKLQRFDDFELQNICDSQHIDIKMSVRILLFGYDVGKYSIGVSQLTFKMWYLILV